MKRTLILLIICAMTCAMTSCKKDNRLSLDDPSEVAKVTITRADSSDDIVTLFSDMAVYRESDMEGKSWLSAFRGGKMVYDAFMLSVYFDCIDNLNAGDTITPSRVMFSFFYSSDSNASTHEYKGTISLAEKSDDYVIIHFDEVRFTCSFGEYTINGNLKCPLYERHL